MKLVRVMIAFGLLFAAGCGEKGHKEKAKAAIADEGRDSGGVSWYSSLPEGMALAKSKGKPLMVDFFARWCGACKLMDRKTYSDPAVRKAAGDFVSVKIDVTNDSAVAKKYRVQALPTIIFMSSTGKTVHKVIGFREPAALLGEMRVALAKAEED